MILPPPPVKPFSIADGVDHPNAADLVTYSDGLVMECYHRRALRDEHAQRNINLYVGNHFLTIAVDESERFVWNRIRTVAISHAAIQNSTRPHTKFSPRESGEPGISYFNLQTKLPSNPEVSAILSQIRPEAMQMGPAGEFPQPLTTEEAALLSDAIEEGKQLTEQAAGLGLGPPPVVPPEALVTINDSSAADALQIAFDAMWEDCSADFFVMENSLYNGVVGWQFMLYQFDDENKKHILWNPEFTQVFCDTTRTDIEECQWGILDHVLSADEAIARYPELEQVIREKSTDGHVVPAGTYVYAPSSTYQETIFQRSMLTLRTNWIRNQRYPLLPQDAVSQGLVTSRKVPQAAQSAIATDGDAQGLFRRAASAIKKFLVKGDDDEPPDEVPAITDPSDTGMEGNREDSSEGDPSLDANSNRAGGAAGDSAGGGVQPDPAMRDAYFVNDPSGSEVEVQPGHKLWPTRSGIRRYQIIVGEVVSDAEAETVDIPLAHNVNFPIPYSPWGQGTPEDLEGLNLALDNVLSDLVVHHEYNTFPQQTIPQSVHSRLPESAQNKYIRPGTPMVVPDDIFKMNGGKLFANQDAPPMSPDAWKLLNQLVDLINQQGEMAQVLNGQAAPGWSGDAIGKLQAAAQGSILFRSKRMERMVRYLSRLMIGSILNRVGPDFLAKRIRKYPIYIWYGLHDWMRNNLEFDISTEIASGGGVNKQQQTQQILGAAQQGVPISPQTQIEALGKDPDVELRQSLQWQQKMAAASPQRPSAPPATTAAPPPSIPPQ